MKTAQNERPRPTLLTCAGARSGCTSGMAGTSQTSPSKTLRISGGCLDDIVDRFFETGDVKTRQGQRHAPPHNSTLTSALELKLMDRIIDNPEFTLSEHRNAWEDSTGKHVHLGTICRSSGWAGRANRCAAVTRPPLAAALTLARTERLFSWARSRGGVTSSDATSGGPGSPRRITSTRRSSWTRLPRILGATIGEPLPSVRRA